MRNAETLARAEAEIAMAVSCGRTDDYTLLSRGLRDAIASYRDAACVVVEAENAKMREAALTVLRGFDEGVFVRSILGDDDTGWAFRLFPFVRALTDLRELSEPKTQ